VNPNKFKQRRTVPRLFTTLFITSMAGAFVPLAHAVDWQGSASTDWSDAGNWSAGSVPTAADDVTIDWTAAISNGQATNKNASVGFNPGSKGTVTVEGKDSSWTNAENLVIGNEGAGTLTVRNGAQVTSDGGRLAAYEKSEGNVTVDGNDSKWVNSGQMEVGQLGTGALTISNAGEVTNTNGFIGIKDGGKGTVTVDGKDSRWTNAGSLAIGNQGAGTLTIRNGAQVTSDGGRLAAYEKSEGNVTVDGQDSKWVSTGQMAVGQLGTAALTISNAGEVTSTNGYVGTEDGGKGTVTVDGKDSKWVSSGWMAVGQLGTGALTISNAGEVTSTSGFIGEKDGGKGTVTVDGKDSRWTNAGSLAIGNKGAGTLTVRNGAQVTSDGGRLAAYEKSEGNVTVDGQDSKWVSTGQMVVGRLGTGALTISNAGEVTSTSGFIGEKDGGKGTVTVDGKDSKWASSGVVSIGQEGGTGSLTISNGGEVTSTEGYIGTKDGGKGTVTVDGKDSKWASSGGISVGQKGGTGSLTISSGGEVTSTGGYIGTKDGVKGTVTVDGKDSKWASSGVVSIGQEGGTGSLTISNGGEVTSTEGYIGTKDGGKGTVTVDGKDSKWANSGGISVGQEGGTGSLTISNGGVVKSAKVEAGGGGSIGASSGSTGSVTVQGAGSAWEDVGGMRVGDKGAGTLTVRDGGHVAIASDQLFIANKKNSKGTVLVDGKDSTLTSHDVLSVGVQGAGSLTIINGGVVNSGDSGTPGILSSIGKESGGTGSVQVRGPGSEWKHVGDIEVGENGEGALTISDGGRVVSTGNTVVGKYAGGTGAVIVDGVGSSWDSGGGIGVGAQGAGSLTISNGALVKSAAPLPGNLAAIIGFGLGGTGSVLVEGPGSAWEAEGNVAVGYTDEGTLTIRGGGRVSSNGSGVANGPESKGTVVVDGKGSSWANSGVVAVGVHGSGSLSITNGGLVTSAGSDSMMGGGIGDRADGIGTVLVEGPGSAWEAKGQFVVGGAGQGTLTIRDGGRVSSDVGLVAAAANSKGKVIIAGKDSVWTNSSLLNVGSEGDGSLTLRNDGSAKASKVLVADAAGSTGTLNIGAAAGETATGAGTLDTPTVEFGDGTGKLVFNHTNTDYRFSPVVSGAGSVEVHAGTTQFGDANSYSGGTAIHGGTLVGTATSFGSGAIANDGELVVDQAVKAAFNNALSGKGNFIKRGAGQLDFASDGSGFTGATQVAAGALSVNGSLANSRVTVASGATLKGNGTVGATSILAGGTIAPGNSIGTLTVKGDYTQAAGSTYQAEVDPATLGSSDRILVGGTATLEEGAILNVVKTAPHDYQPGARYDVLTAQGGVKGAYKLTGDTDLSAFIGLRQATTDDGVYLLTFQSKPLAAAAATPNQAAVANAIPPAVPTVAPPTAPTAVQPAAPVATRPTATAAAQPATPSAAQVQPARSVLTTALLNQQTDAAARAAFDQLSGDVHASVKGALLDDSRFVRGAALDRLRDASCNASPSSVDGAATTCSASRSTPSVWASTFGSWGHAAQLDRTIGGFAAGADVAVGDTWRVGVMTGYSHSSFQADARHASAKSDDYHLGVYGGSRWGDLSLRLGTAYTRHDIDTTRDVTFSGFSGKPEAEYRASTTQAFGELGYQVQAGAVALEPFANLAYVNLHTNRFNERGGEAALRSNGTDNDATFTTLGLHAQTEWALGGVPVTAKGTLGWQHAFGGTVPNARFSLAGGRSFDIEGTPIARDAALVEAGLNFKVAPQANLGITYAGKFGGHANDQSVRASFAMKF
jgi:fibronectin-binding autotransporter adhesin